MNYRFQKPTTAETPTGPKTFKDGQSIDGNTLTPGCLESCLVAGLLVEDLGEAAPAPEVPALELAAATPEKPSAKRVARKTAARK